MLKQPKTLINNALIVMKEPCNYNAGRNHVGGDLALMTCWEPAGLATGPLIKLNMS